MSLRTRFSRQCARWSWPRAIRVRRIIVVTDLALPADSDPRGRWPEESRWLRERYRTGATLCSVCTGSVLLARFCGEVEAVRKAKFFLLDDRSEGQMLYAAGARPRRHEDAVIARCQAWIAEHDSLDNPVARLVAQSGLVERTFERRFQAATG